MFPIHIASGGGGGSDGGTPPVDPPEEGWPDVFMSYPAQTAPIILDGVSGTEENPYVIEEMSFQDFYDANGSGPNYNGNGGRPITLENCSHILIRRIDTRRCTMGLVYALDSDHITVEYCRVENVNYQHKGVALNTIPIPGGGTGNDNNMNYYQFDKVDTFTVRHCKGRYGNMEDVLSHYHSSNGDVDDFHFEGGVATNQLTSDGFESVPWTSDSGTGIINTDDLGHDCVVHDSTFLNCGQVNLQLGGTDNTIRDCVAYGEGNTAQPWNNGCQTWSSGACTGLTFENVRSKYFRTGGETSPFWWGCSTPATINCDLDDDSIDPNDLKVTL